jgi:ferredoxin-NADP reductase
MLAKEYLCKVIAKSWLTPSVIELKFEPAKKFSFQPGQFFSLKVPSLSLEKGYLMRLYSFSTSPERARADGFEMCVKYVPGGAGSRYLESLQVGDRFRMVAPYGDFQYRVPEAGKSVCFISTGTGIGPVRSMILSRPFLENPPERALCLFGARTRDELLYRQEFEKVGVESVYALSRDITATDTFHGRVTDFLVESATRWNWHKSDYYLCGNAEMIREAYLILTSRYGVSERNIYKENFSSPKHPARVEAPAPSAWAPAAGVLYR